MNEDGTRKPPGRPEGLEFVGPEHGRLEDVRAAYVRPRVEQSEKIVSRAVACAKHNSIDCPGGPITS